MYKSRVKFVWLWCKLNKFSMRQVDMTTPFILKKPFIINNKTKTPQNKPKTTNIPSISSEKPSY